MALTAGLTSTLRPATVAGKKTGFKRYKSINTEKARLRHILRRAVNGARERTRTSTACNGHMALNNVAGYSKSASSASERRLSDILKTPFPIYSQVSTIYPLQHTYSSAPGRVSQLSSLQGVLRLSSAVIYESKRSEFSTA